MPLSASCLVQENAGPFVPTTGGVDVSSSGPLISIKLASTTSVSTWKLEVFGTDETTTAPSLTNVNPTTHVVTTPSTIVTFTYPSGVGRAIVFRSTVDDGASGSDIQTFGIYVPFTDGSRVGAAGETREGEPDFGWTIKVNPIIRGLATLAGDVTGTIPNLTVARVNGTTVPTTSGGDVGKVLQVTGAGAAAWQTFSTTPSGPAGGDLSGTYPNPTVAKISSLGAGVVHSDSLGHLSSSAIVNADVDAAAAIAGSKINPNFGSQTVTGGQAIFTAIRNTSFTTGIVQSDGSGNFSSSTSIIVSSIRDTGLSTGVVHSDVSGNFTSSQIVNADVSATAAIAGTKISPNFGSQTVVAAAIQDTGLSTGVVHSDGSGNFSSSTVVNADVSATAAIAGTKISPNFGSQNVSTTGTLSAGATTATSIRDTGLGTGVVHSDVSGNFTSTTIVNADVDAAAAIDGTKINPNFGSQNVQTTGTGTFGNLSVNGAKVLPLPQTIPYFGVAGLQSNAGSGSNTFMTVGMIRFDPSAIAGTVGNVTRTINFRAHIWGATGDTVQVQLYNLDDAEVVTGTLLSATSTTPTRVTATGLTVGASAGNIKNAVKTYLVQICVSSPNPATSAEAAYIGSARLDVDYA